MRKYTKRSLWIVGISSALVAALLLPAVVFAGPPSPLDPASAKAAGSSFMFWLAFWIATVVFVGVQGALIYAVIRFKEKDPAFIPQQIHGDTRLEIIWTIIPALVMIAMFGTAWPIMQSRNVPEPENGEPLLEVVATGHQWWWEFDYPESGVNLGNELHIPVGEPVIIKLVSNNVLHSFWVPRLSGKMDVVPGRTNEMWIQADEAGVYRGICAELCGAQHANMTFTVIAEPREQFEAWTAAQLVVPGEPDDELVTRGKAVFMANQCIACHKIEGTIAQGILGPNLTHFANRRTIAGLVGFENNEENIRRWVSNPQGHKPLVAMPNLYLPKDELDAIVAYLRSLE